MVLSIANGTKMISVKHFGMIGATQLTRTWAANPAHNKARPVQPFLQNFSAHVDSGSRLREVQKFPPFCRARVAQEERSRTDSAYAPQASAGRETLCQQSKILPKEPALGPAPAPIPRSGWRRIISRRNRRCLARSSSITTPSTGSPISSRPEHFSEEVHRRIFDVASQLIRAGKLASPITLKTFLGEHDLGGVTVPQYLARLAAEATTVINAEDYGRTIHDLALRRDLILIGEDIVNAAYDAPVNATPREQIEDAERKLYSIAETGRYEGGFQRFSDALTTAVDMAAKAYRARRTLVGDRDGPRRSRSLHGRPAAVRSCDCRRASRNGQDGACDQHRLQHR